MARFDSNTADKYGGHGGTGFFSLKEDKDWAAIRYMYETFEQIENEACFTVHTVEIDGKKRYVNCLREYNDPMHMCPFCEEGYMVKPRVFLHLYDVASGEVKLWDRGKGQLNELSSLTARYSPLCSTVFELERNGKKGDKSTMYVNYAQSTDDTLLDDLPEVDPLLGTFILDKTAEEMDYFLRNGRFAGEEGNSPQRNPERDRRPRQDSQQRAPQRQAAPARPPRGQESRPSRNERAPRREEPRGNRENFQQIEDDDDAPF